MTRTPAFWYTPPDRPTLLARALTPLGWLYAAGTARRLRRGGITPPVPVICVGNLVAGGAGKTPVALAMVERLTQRGHAVHVVSRGYGGSLAGPVQVDPLQHQASEVGDEPLLLAAFAPTWVAKDRAAGLREAVAAGAGVVVMDDGFQNPAIRPSLAIVVADAARGFGNGRCIPAGPLREPVGTGLARADVVLAVGEAKAQAAFQGLWGAQVRVPLVKAALKVLPTGMDWQDQPVQAFAGIANPERFFATLRDLGARLVRAEALADHAPLSKAFLQRLEAEASAAGAQLVTTEKDAVRLPPAWRAKVLTVVVRLAVDDWTEIDARLRALGL